MSELKIEFETAEPELRNTNNFIPPSQDPWSPIILTKEAIDTEIGRLSSTPVSDNGRRETLIVHPRSLGHAPGLAPGIQVKLCVLRPGERTQPFRHNATEVSFCIQGEGRAIIDGQQIKYGQYDVWNTPSFATQYWINDSDDLQVCLNYSNAALLQYMQIYARENNPQPVNTQSETKVEMDPRKESPFGSFAIDDGAQLMPYELLINPPSVVSPALHWPWQRVQEELVKLEKLGKDYIGRRLYLLYNPMTGRTNGTTPSFFATITTRPPGIVDRPHRHVSAAINYYFSGHGRSTVAGNVYEWKAGDLMLSAPGWAVHNHASYDEPVHELTIQDQPLHIAMESLLWQEKMNEPPTLLGAHPGFETNRNAAHTS